MMPAAGQADILARFTDANTGDCYGSALATYPLKDGRVGGKKRWTALLQKSNGEWKAGAVHLALNFLDPPILRAGSMSFGRKRGILLPMAKPPSD